MNRRPHPLHAWWKAAFAAPLAMCLGGCFWAAFPGPVQVDAPRGECPAEDALLDRSWALFRKMQRPDASITPDDSLVVMRTLHARDGKGPAPAGCFRASERAINTAAFLLTQYRGQVSSALRAQCAAPAVQGDERASEEIRRYLAEIDPAAGCPVASR